MVVVRLESESIGGVQWVNAVAQDEAHAARIVVAWLGGLKVSPLRRGLSARITIEELRP